MSTEIPKQPHPGDNAEPTKTAAASLNLSQEVFANPVDFLTTLKATLPKANPDDPDNVTYRDLVAYASTPGDPRGSAAAAIAAQHWPELRALDKVLEFNVPSSGAGLSADELNIDIDFAKGNVKSELLNQELGSGGLALVFGTMATGLGFATAASLPVPFLSIPAAGGTLLFGGMAGASAYDAFTEPGKVQAKVTQDQHLLASWQNINGNAAGRTK